MVDSFRVVIAMDLEKGGSHKYIKRVPTGKPKPKYRYFYKMPKEGLVTKEDMVVGSQFRYGEEEAHYTISEVNGDSITVFHEQSQQSRTVSFAQLKDLLDTDRLEQADPKANKDNQSDQEDKADMQGGEEDIEQSKTWLENMFQEGTSRENAPTPEAQEVEENQKTQAQEVEEEIELTAEDMIVDEDGILGQISQKTKEAILPPTVLEGASSKETLSIQEQEGLKESIRSLLYELPEEFSPAQKGVFAFMIDAAISNVEEKIRFRANPEEIRQFAQDQELLLSDEISLAQILSKRKKEREAKEQQQKEREAREQKQKADHWYDSVFTPINEIKQDKKNALYLVALKKAKKQLSEESPVIQQAIAQRIRENYPSGFANALLSQAKDSIDRYLFAEKEQKGASIREKKWITPHGETASKINGYSYDMNEYLKKVLNDADRLDGYHYQTIKFMLSRGMSADSKPSSWAAHGVSFAEQAAKEWNDESRGMFQDLSSWCHHIANAKLFGYEPLSLNEIMNRRKAEQAALDSIAEKDAHDILSSAGLDVSEGTSPEIAKKIAGNMELLKSIGARHRLLTTDEAGLSMGRISLQAEDIQSSRDSNTYKEDASFAIWGQYSKSKATLTINTSVKQGMESFAHELWHGMDFGYSVSKGNTDLSSLSSGANDSEGIDMFVFLDGVAEHVEKNYTETANRKIAKLKEQGAMVAAQNEEKTSFQMLHNYYLMPEEIFARLGEQWTSYKIAEAQAKGQISNHAAICQPYATLVDSALSGGCFLPHDVFMSIKDKFEQTAFFKKIQGSLSKHIDNVRVLRKGFRIAVRSSNV